MRRLSRTVTRLAVAGAVAGIALGPAAALAASGDLDASAHSYGFDHNLSDAAGGPDAAMHGSVPFAAGRLDPPETGDGAVRFDGRPTDYLSIAPPALDYGTADFTIDIWLSTTASRTETILDTGGSCSGGARGYALVMSATGHLSVRVGQSGEDDGSETTTPGDDAKTTAGADGATTGQSAAVAAFLHALNAEDREGGGDHPHDPTPGAPRANDGHWHEATLVRTGATMVVRLDTTIEQTLTLTANPDFVGNVGVRVGRGWCEGDHSFQGELDDLSATPAPPVALPEAPVAAILPLSAAMIGAVVIARRRGRRRPGHVRRR